MFQSAYTSAGSCIELHASRTRSGYPSHPFCTQAQPLGVLQTFKPAGAAAHIGPAEAASAALAAACTAPAAAAAAAAACTAPAAVRNASGGVREPGKIAFAVKTGAQVADPAFAVETRAQVQDPHTDGQKHAQKIFEQNKTIPRMHAHFP